jgi:flagellin
MVITRINNNITALTASRNLQRSGQSLAQSLERLSSGLRINRAADDASGLSISERLRSQIRGLNRAVQNAQDAINLVNTAEGALDETTSILQRMRELSVQAANSGGQDAAAIQFAQDEIDSLISEITRIGEETQFSTRFLLNGDNASVASIEGANLGLDIVQGPVSSTLTDGTHFLSVTEISQATVTPTAGADGALNSGAIAVNPEQATFDTGSYTLTIGNAQAESARVQDTSAFTQTASGDAVVAATRVEDAQFNGFDIDAADEIILSGTYADGTAADTVTLTVVAGPAPNSDDSLANFTGFINAIGNFFTDPQPTELTDGAPGGGAEATAALNADGSLTITDATAGESETSLTVQVVRGGTVQVQETVEVTNEGNQNQAVVSLGGGPAQQVVAGETYTIRGADPRTGETTAPIPTAQLQFGTNSSFVFSDGEDTISMTAGSYRANLDGGEDIFFQNGDRNVRLISGTGGGQFTAGEQVIVNFDEAVSAGTTTIVADSTALNFQIGANAEQQVKIQIGNVTSANLGFVGQYAVDGSLFEDDGTAVTENTSGAAERTVSNLDVRTVEGANEAIKILDEAISQVSAQRSSLGAFTNRLESTVNNLSVASENLATSESRIRDADIAFETTQFTRNQILVQAGTSILAQANLAPQSVLQLLG